MSGIVIRALKQQGKGKRARILTTEERVKSVANQVSQAIYCLPYDQVIGKKGIIWRTKQKCEVIFPKNDKTFVNYDHVIGKIKGMIAHVNRHIDDKNQWTFTTETE
jgi:hypothetical protein